jgi:hypothetical protein
MPASGSAPDRDVAGSTGWRPPHWRQYASVAPTWFPHWLQNGICYLIRYANARCSGKQAGADGAVTVYNSRNQRQKSYHKN